MQSLEEQMLKHHTEYYEEAVTKLVTRLRDMADRVERESKPYDKPGMGGTPRYSAAAESVLNGLAWDTANAHAAHLAGAAARVDAAETALAASRKPVVVIDDLAGIQKALIDGVIEKAEER